MKKSISIILILFLILLSSCELLIEDNEIFDHDISFDTIDESNNFNNKYRIKEETYSNEDYEITKEVYRIYEIESNKLVDEIIDYNRKILIRNLIIYEDYVYVFAYNYIKEKLTYSYAKLGESKINLVNMIPISRSLKYIKINGILFGINDRSSWLMGDKLGQRHLPNESNWFFYSSTESNSLCYFRIENKEVVIKDYYTDKIIANYPISQEVKDAKYNSAGNSFDEHYTEEDKLNFFGILYSDIKLLGDENLYFTYFRYLGEFERCECYKKDCLLSKKICEILRFNPQKNIIEQVAIVPENYTVLKAYEHHAIIINNKHIATYNYQTKEISDIYEIDINDELKKSKHEYPSALFFFENQKFVSLSINRNISYQSNVEIQD